jgi:hypothetical protein
MRSLPPGGDDRRVAQPVRIELELDLVDPIKGTVREPGKAERPFQGWLQLLSTLDAVRAGERQDTGASE